MNDITFSINYASKPPQEVTSTPDTYLGDLISQLSERDSESMPYMPTYTAKKITGAKEIDLDPNKTLAELGIQNKDIVVVGGVVKAG